MKNPSLEILTSPDWIDYELLDTGAGLKLERYGPYSVIRPEHQAVWKQALPEKDWQRASAIFQPAREESGGSWQFHQPIPDSWHIRYRQLAFKVALSNSRHMGFFPEQANHWDWLSDLIRSVKNSPRVLNLFGYTGLATLAAAQAGATVTHLDASKKAISWAKTNQELSRLSNKPIRWLVDDALKFIHRESRRGSTYEGIILDPPKFGRGPSGQVWEFFEELPELLTTCRKLLSKEALFVIITAYAIRASAITMYQALGEMVKGLPGEVTAGELALTEQSHGRLLSMAIFARWRANTSAKKE